MSDSVITTTQREANRPLFCESRCLVLICCVIHDCEDVGAMSYNQVYITQCYSDKLHVDCRGYLMRLYLSVVGNSALCQDREQWPSECSLSIEQIV